MVSRETVAVEPQVFSLLIYLIENKERVISKDELIENIWEGRFVSESAISSRIKSARKTLNDDGKTQRLIKTVHGVGFRFVGELKESDEIVAASLLEPESGTIDVDQNPQRRAEDKNSLNASEKPVENSKRLVLPIAALILVIAIIYLVFKPSNDFAPSESRIAILPIDNATQDALHDWTSLGLMSYVSHYLSKGANVKTVSPQSTMAIAGEGVLTNADTLSVSEDVLVKLRNSQGASHVVMARLEVNEQLLSIRYSVYTPDGQSPVQTIVGETPIELAKKLGQSIISTLPRSGELKTDLRAISDDPFISEAYSRGRALQLQGDPEEARNLFKVASEQGPSDIWLRYEYALSTRMMGEAEEALLLFEVLAEEAKQHQNISALVSIQNALGILYWRKGDRATAAEYYQSALSGAEKVDDKKYLGTILINLGILARNKGDTSASRHYLNRALTTFSEAGYPQPPGSLLNSLSNLEQSVGNVDIAKKYLLQALEGARLINNKRHAAAMLTNLGLLEQQLGNWQLSEVYLEEGLEIRQQLKHKIGITQSLNALAELKTDIGQFNSAITYANTAIGISKESNNQPLLARSLSAHGIASLMGNNIVNGRADLTKANSIYSELGQNKAVNNLTIYLERADFQEKNRDSAFPLTHMAVDSDSSEYSDSTRLLAFELAADIQLATEDLRSAEISLENALVLAEKRKENTILVRLSVKLGMLHLQNNQPDLAAAFLGNARQLLPEMYETLKLGAYYENHQGNYKNAKKLMNQAKLVAFDRWSEDDQQALSLFESAASKSQSEVKT